MKRLILIRHAKTEPLSSAINDFERQLKSRGQKDSRLVATHLIEKNVIPGIIISSPAVRALETARLFARNYDMSPEDIVERRLIYDGFSIQSLIDEISHLANGIDSVMVVGHNPDIAMAAIQFSNDNFFHFPTAAAVVLSFNTNVWEDLKPGKGHTELFVTPKDLKKK